MKLYRAKYKLIETYGVFMMDLLAIAAAYFVAHRLRILLPFGAKITEETAWFPIYVLCIIGCILYNLSMNRYAGFFGRGYFVEVQEALKYNVVQFVFLSTCVYLFRLELDFSRLMLVYFAVCDTILCYLFRILFKSVINHNYKKGRGSEKILIVTDSHTLGQVKEHIQKDQGWNYEVVGVALTDVDQTGQMLADDDQANDDSVIPNKAGEAVSAVANGHGEGADSYHAQEDISKVGYELRTGREKFGTNVDKEEKDCHSWQIVAGKNNLLDIARQMPIDIVFFFCPNERDNSVLENWIQSFLVMGVPCYYCIQNFQFHISSNGVGEFADFPVMCYNNTLERDWRMSVIKRLADILGGFVGLIITALLFPFIAIAIKAEDVKGPIFFSQIRIGKNGRRFRMYKYRSMYADAEERKKELMAQNEVQGPMFKLENDPRITKVGRFLRRTSLDELPQFWNIFKGDMSLVGTRPPTVEEFEQYNDYYRRRMSITPGLTGMWQVSGRSDIKDFNEVVKLDLQYIDHWSIGQDIKILIQTVGAVIKGSGSR